MTNLNIIGSDFKKRLDLFFAQCIKAGFPSPADDYRHNVLGIIRQDDVNRFEEVEIICHDPYENTKLTQVFTVDDVMIFSIPKWKKMM